MSAKRALAAVAVLLASAIASAGAKTFPQAVRTIHKRTTPTGTPLTVNLAHLALSQGAASSSAHARTLRPILRPPRPASRPRPSPRVLSSLTTAPPADGATAPLQVDANASVLASFDGINSWDMQYAGGVNQGAVDPPDQGLCVGNGYVVETVNGALRVFSATSPGKPLTAAVAANVFHGYPPTLDKATGARQPYSLVDPSCIYDAPSRRWFHVIAYVAEADSGGESGGRNHLEVAVSTTADPTGVWMFYRIPTQNDGSEGTVDHGCPHGSCRVDFPRIAVNAYGLYITTNEFDATGAVFMSANVLAVPKSRLIGGAASLQILEFQTLAAPSRSAPANKAPGVNVCPALLGADAPHSEDVQYFLSSDGNNWLGGGMHVLLWKLAGVSALGSPGFTNATISLSATLVRSRHRFSPPPAAAQRRGSYPLGRCLTTAGCVVNDEEFGPLSGDIYPEQVAELDTGRATVLSATYAAGKVWGVISTSAECDGSTVTGALWFAVNPVSEVMARAGVIASAGTHLLFPSIAVTAAAVGVVSFTLTGKTAFPRSRTGRGRPCARWGDYGAAVVDEGGDIWVGCEYVAQTCTLGEYLASTPKYSCNCTRTALTNWGTRITKIKVA